MKKIKYRQRNSDFKFWPEVKVTREIYIFSAAFSNQIFTWSGRCQELKLIGKLSDCPQILTVGRLTHKQQNVVCEFSLSKYFFLMRAIFVQTLDIFLILFRKRYIPFHCNWVWQYAHTFFSALGPETEEQIKLAKHKMCFDL